MSLSDIFNKIDNLQAFFFFLEKYLLFISI